MGIEIVPVLVVILKKFRMTELDCRSDPCLQSLTNELAAGFYSAIVIAIADVLQRFWHLREGAPLALV